MCLISITVLVCLFFGLMECVCVSERGRGFAFARSHTQLLRLTKNISIALKQTLLQS